MRTSADLVLVRGRARLERGELALHLAAPRLVALDLDEDLLHEHVDLAVLALDAADVLLELGTHAATAGVATAGARPPGGPSWRRRHGHGGGGEPGPGPAPPILR